MGKTEGQKMPGTGRLQQNLEAVKERIAAACDRAGRSPNDVTLVAVTKTVDLEIAAMLPLLGVADVGESRPQELWRKAAAISGVRWHLIGHLQRNKIERTLPLVHLIHSMDSERLLLAVDDAAGRLERNVDVLLELNLSREPRKSGLAATDLPLLSAAIDKLHDVRIRGLMTMAALSEEPEQSRPVFAELRQVRDRLRGEIGPQHTLEHLSMGMSQDFEIAIEEGATLIRVGSALFEGLP